MKSINNQNHLSDEQIALYVDALRLDKLEKVSPEILEHIEACKPCHRQAIDLYSLLGEADYGNIGAHPTLDKKSAMVMRLPNLLLRVAAAIALLIIALYFFNRNTSLEDPGNLVKEDAPIEKTEIVEQPNEEGLNKDDSNQKEEVVVKDAPVKITSPKEEVPQQKNPVLSESHNNRDLYAANFTPSEDWDEMAGESVRANDFEVLSPKLNKAFKPNVKIPFQWEGDEDDRYLILLNNLGAEINKVKVLSNNIDLDMKLVPGLYYWKLESEDDLLYVGKFTVE